MPRLGISGRHRTRSTIGLVALLAVAGVTAALIAVNSPGSNAATTALSQSCSVLDTALQNNQNFIAGQQAKPDAQSAARVINRQAVVDLIQQRLTADGCAANGAAADKAAATAVNCAA